ncbi:UNVERIFIED_CONTAM: F-box protein [Sesamum radiatum]|uniref:F-box protein n=1 Tax=Sesamum radiatum TaxID=300843 RepID=A0AAW2L226_SESRA
MAESIVDIIPPESLMETLARLPLKTLFASRSACKTFVNLTSVSRRGKSFRNLTSFKPEFIALHSANATQVLALQFGDSNMLNCVDPEVDVDPEFVQNVRLKPMFRMPDFISQRTYSRDQNKSLLVNSCNGLLYFVRRCAEDERSFVCNPVTSEYFLIPDVDRDTEPRFLSSVIETKSMWLGYSPGSDNYKVLRLFSHSYGDPLDMGAEVLEVGSDSWKLIGKPPLSRDVSWDCCSTTLNGVLYWLDQTWKDIFFFDFEKEIFGEIALPSEYGEEQLSKIECMSIGVLGGCLSLSFNVHDAPLVDVWVMKKHGDEESWSKEFIVDAVSPSGVPLYGQFRPLQVLKNGEILMLWINNDLVCYNPRNKSLRYAGFDHLDMNPRAVGFTPSLISLKDTLSVNEVRHSERPW